MSKHPSWCTCECTCEVCIPDTAERAAEVLRQELPELDAVFDGKTSRTGNIVTTSIGGKRVTIRVEDDHAHE